MTIYDKRPGFPREEANVEVKSKRVYTIVVLTQAQFDAIDPKDPNTLYFIIEE